MMMKQDCIVDVYVACYAKISTGISTVLRYLYQAQNRYCDRCVHRWPPVTCPVSHQENNMKVYTVVFQETNNL